MPELAKKFGSMLLDTTPSICHRLTILLHNFEYHA